MTGTEITGYNEDDMTALLKPDYTKSDENVQLTDDIDNDSQYS